MSTDGHIVFLFPGQGVQYPGMGKDFVEHYPIARHTFEEAEDILQRKLTSLIFTGPENVLTETRNSQVAIYLVSIAILRVLETLFPSLKPSICAGLSLGEYTALTASRKISFEHCLPIVQMRGNFMHEACEQTKGTMAVVMGLDEQQVVDMIKEVNLPNDLWAANFNCPGQVVISGTIKGIEAGTAMAKAKGAKRVLPLQVHGAFHSGLMRSAEEKLTPYIQQTSIEEGLSSLVMNVPGDTVKMSDQIKHNLIKQVTHPVRWEQGIRSTTKEGVKLYIEIGCGKTLSGMNKRIGVTVPTLSVERIEEIVQLEEFLNKN